MSRIGQQPIKIADGVTVNIDGAEVSVKGPKGDLSYVLPGGITGELADGFVTLTRPDESRESRSFHGLARSLVANMVEGCSTGFKKELEIQGVGFRATLQGRVLELALGFSSTIKFDIPDGVDINVEGGTALTVSGPDRQKVGDTAARIRSFAPAEPYKGKGVRYKGEHVRRKVGKTVA